MQAKCGSCGHYFKIKCPACGEFRVAPSEAGNSLADLVPTNWVDPLLSGPDKALTGEIGKWGCPDIENLLRAVKKRISDAEG